MKYMWIAAVLLCFSWTGMAENFQLDDKNFTQYNYSSGKFSGGEFSGISEYVKGSKTPFLFTGAIKLPQKKLRITFEMSASGSGYGRLFYRLENGKFNDAQRLEFRVKKGNFINYELTLEATALPIVQLRLDTIYQNGVQITLRNFGYEVAAETPLQVKVAPSKAAYRGFPAVKAADVGSNYTENLEPGAEKALESAKLYLNYPAQNHGLKINFNSATPKTGGKIELKLDIFDVVGKVIGEKIQSFPLDNSSRKNLANWVLPENTAAVKLCFRGQDLAEKVQITEVSVEPDFRPGEIWSDWEGNWFWSDKALRVCFFKQDFKLESLPETAYLQINADDSVAEIKINGKPVKLGHNSANPFTADLYEVANLLKLGENSVVIEAHNQSGDRGMMLELAMYGADGKLMQKIVPALESIQVSADLKNWESGKIFNNPYLLPATVEHTFLGEKAPEVPKQFALPPATAGLPECKMEMNSSFHVPMIKVNGKKQTLNHYWGPAQRISRTQLENCVKNGINQYFIGVNYEWRGEGEYDFSAIDDTCRKILSIDPAANIVLEIPVDSFSSPSMKKWNKLYPEELVLDSDLNSMIEIHGIKQQVSSWASDIWLAEAKNIMKSAIQHVAKQNYAGNIIGFFPLAGLGHEWAYYGCHNKLYVDYSKPFQQKFKEYCRINFPEAGITELPGRQIRESASGVLDPEKDAALIAFRAFISDLTANVLLELGKTVKIASQNRSLYGTYYGYTTYTAVETWSENGHFALKKLLDSPYVDFLVSIVRYDNRAPGQESGSIAPVASHWLNGKAAIVQSDLRTHRAAGRKDWVIADFRGSAEVVKRELAWCLISGAAFEFGYYGYGWQAGDARLMELIGKMQKFSYEFADFKKQVNSNGLLAVLVDENSIAHVGQNSDLNRKQVREMLRKIGHSGMGFNVFLLSDLPKIASDYKNFVLLNAVCLPEAQQKLIEQCMTPEKTLVIMPQSGVSDGKTLKAETQFWRQLKAQVILGNAKWTVEDFQAAFKGKAHLYNPESSDATMANGALFAIHTAKKGGKRTLYLPKSSSKCRELFTGAVVPVSNGCINIDTLPESTYLFFCE